MLAAISDNLTGFVSKKIKKSKIKSAYSEYYVQSPTTFRGIIPPGSKCFVGIDPIGMSGIIYNGRIVAKCNLGYMCMYIEGEPNCVSISINSNLDVTEYESTTQLSTTKTWFVGSEEISTRETNDNSNKYRTSFSKRGANWPVGIVDHHNFFQNIKGRLDERPSDPKSASVDQIYTGLVDKIDITYGLNVDGTERKIKEDHKLYTGQFQEEPEGALQIGLLRFFFNMLIDPIGSYIFEDGVFKEGPDPEDAPVRNFFKGLDINGGIIAASKWTEIINTVPILDQIDFITKAYCDKLEYREVTLECVKEYSSGPVVHRFNKRIDRYVSYDCHKTVDYLSNDPLSSLDDYFEGNSQEITYADGRLCEEYSFIVKELNPETGYIETRSEPPPLLRV